MTSSPSETRGLKRFLPPIGSPGYHVMLACVALFILGPLGGISAAYMNFSIGFFVGGQVLAGILGSTVTLPYGPEGKHGANYMQSMAASVAGMCGMAVLIQAMSWLGLPRPPAWQLILYFLCLGMFGVGVGMLYTPILVDRMQLAFPSGYAVANILRALTDKRLLKQSVAKLGGGMGGGYIVALLLNWDALVAKIQVAVSRACGFALPAKAATATAGFTMNLVTSFSASTIGAGMIVGARLALPAVVVGLLGEWLKPTLVSHGWLEPDAPFRKIGFIIALGTILGAAAIDVSLILIQAVKRLQQQKGKPPEQAEDWKRVNTWRLVLWVVCWAVGLVVVGSQVLHQPPFFLVVAIALSFLFVLVNGIAAGISDSNPISSAFVMSVFILAALGLKDPGVGLMSAAIVLLACSEGGDMQQDRSTGWRLGTNRIVQFRYQVIGIAMGAVLAVVLANTFMNAYPVLKQDQFSHKLEGAQQWQSAMTYKFVGALRGITNPKPHVMEALRLGLLIGVLTEVARKLLKSNRSYKEFSTRSRGGRVSDFVIDSFLLPSPYASSFGGFVELSTLVWWGIGGVFGSVYEWANQRRKARNKNPAEGEIPADMSTTSLVGGGLIAGDSLAALSIGIFMLLKQLLSGGNAP
jgi:uncharacterized oligopeptide transporter (OPT) family protein